MSRFFHNFATDARRAAALDAARTALGHAHADVTLDYAELDMRESCEIARKIGRSCPDA